MGLTGSQVLGMYLECSHPKFNHDIETVMMALIAIRGSYSITSTI